MTLVCLSFLLCLAVSSADNLPLFLFNSSFVQQTGARCLDGSPAGYYKASTVPQAKNSWVIFMQGGGLCYTAQACRERAKSALGSSTYWSNSVNSGNNILSSDPANPFSTWNRVLIPYCGGDTHVGTNKQPDSNGFYFAGHLILEGVVAHLKATANLGAATQVLISGGSAGGIGTFNNVDWFAAQFPNAVVKAMPFAGYFFSPTAVPMPEWLAGVRTPVAPEGTRMLHDFYKNTYVNTNCARANPDAPWKCWWAGVVYPHIQTPLLNINNIFDTSQMSNMMYRNDGKPDHLNYRGWFGTDLVQGFVKMANATGKHKDGYYFSSCYNHGENFCIKSAMKVNGWTIVDVIGDWFFETGKVPHRLVDSCWSPVNSQPCNTHCACN